MLGLDVHKEVPATQPWAELGVDSVMMVELKIRLERALQITLPVEKLVRDTNTHGLATFVADKLDHAVELDAEPASPAAAPSTPEELERLQQPRRSDTPNLFYGG